MSSTGAAGVGLGVGVTGVAVVSKRKVQLIVTEAPPDVLNVISYALVVGVSALT